MAKTDATLPTPPSSAELLQLADGIPCLVITAGGERPAGCACHGCVARAAVQLAAGHLEAGRLFECHLKLSHANYIFPSLSVVRAEREIHTECLARNRASAEQEGPSAA